MLAIDYFVKLANVYNMIPADKARVDLEPNEIWYPIRDTLAMIADRSIRLEQQAGSNTLPNKEILLLELTTLAGNKDKKQAVYDMARKIFYLAIEAIKVILDKETPRAESENNESELEEFQNERYKIAYSLESWKKITPANIKNCIIITPHDICLPKWYTELYTNQRHMGVLMPQFFEPNED